ncbi:MAG: mannitol dehydrogenase [Christensenellaceae bacterium]|nr:mannitol dehydrogenase [Christensenellaceae bacterium]
MKKVLIVGAGMTGKGFMGEAFDSAPNWEVAYLDKDPRVVEEMLKPEGFTVECSYADKTILHQVTDYQVFLTDEEYSCADFAIASDAIFMPLYPEDFDEACAYLGKILSRRAKENPDQPLDIISVTNFNHYIPHIEEQFLLGLEDDAAREWFKEKVYLRDSIIRRSTIAESNYATKLRTMVVATLLIQQPLHNDIDGDIEWMETRDNIELLKDMKVYTVNSVHATFAYAGYLKGYTTVDQGMNDPEVCEHIEQVISEATHGLVYEFPLTEADIHEMFDFMRIKLDTPLDDTVLRVSWDPIRKLARGDRLTGNAVYCYDHGREPVALMKTMAMAFAYDNPADPRAMEIQEYIKANGIEAAVPHYTGLPADHHIVKTVIANYKEIKA